MWTWMVREKQEMAMKIIKILLITTIIALVIVIVTMVAKSKINWEKIIVAMENWQNVYLDITNDPSMMIIK